MSTELNLEGSWNEVREKIKETNIELTDDDLVYEPGKEDVLLNRLSQKMNRGPQQVKMLIESISSNKGRAS
jgi:uncharacterized protein YjbJ (UPF0337 family)